MSRAIVTVGVSQVRKFGPYHARFERTLRTPLSRADAVYRWMREWPPGSPPHVGPSGAHYAFKVYALREAVRRGHTQLLWLDACAYAVASLEPLWAKIEKEGHFIACNTTAPQFDPLGRWSSDYALKTFGVTRDEAMHLRLPSGSCLGLDLRHARSRIFFDHLLSYANAEHFNGTHRMENPGRVSNDPRCEGHRSDEVYVALLARQLGMATSGGYFTGGMPPEATTVLRSGYDIAEPVTPTVLETVGEHTIDAAAVGAGGWVLDAGCRDFSFARKMAERGCRVVALDADPTVADPQIEGVHFEHLALSDTPGEFAFVMSSDPQARHLGTPAIGVPAGGEPVVPVQAVTIADLMKKYGVSRWDVVKLDIEGAEYDILLDFPGPIARQISIEFHEHVRQRPPEMYDAIFARLERFGYQVIQHQKEARHCCPASFWDSLVKLKEAT